MDPSRVVAAVSALTVALYYPAARAEKPCPSTFDQLPVHERVARCLEHAQESPEPNTLAETRLELFRIIREEYFNKAASLEWVQTYGDEMVQDATASCENTSSLPQDMARRVLTECHDLRDLNIRTLENYDQGSKPFMNDYRIERDAVARALEALPPDRELESLPHPEPTTATIAKAPMIRPHRGHQAGLGIGVTLGLTSLAALIGANLWGSAVSREIGDEVAGRTGQVCQQDDRPTSCDRLNGPRTLVVTSALGLAAGVALTTTFAVLLRRAKRGTERMVWHAAPSRHGFQAGLSLRF